MNFSKYLPMLAEGEVSETCKLLLQHLALPERISQIVAPFRAGICSVTLYIFCVDKKNQLDVTFWILYFSSNSCSTCFGQPCAHHQELTTA